MGIKKKKKGGKKKTHEENQEEMKLLRFGSREKLGHITGKDREKDSYRGEEKRSNTSSHAK